MENEQKNEKTGNETRMKSVKIDGVSAQINLGPGSETHRRFAKLMIGSGEISPRDFVSVLMDSYETPPKDADSVATIADLTKQVKDLNTHIDRLNVKLGTKEGEIDDLNAKLEAAIQEANTNAESSLGKQLQLDELKQRTEGAIMLKPNPVSMFFLHEMAQKENTTPGKILERLFIDDLQNPRANNLPYTVSASRIREVMEQLRKDPEK